MVGMFKQFQEVVLEDLARVEARVLELQNMVAEMEQWLNSKCNYHLQGPGFVLDIRSNPSQNPVYQGVRDLWEDACVELERVYHTCVCMCCIMFSCHRRRSSMRTWRRTAS